MLVYLKKMYLHMYILKSIINLLNFNIILFSKKSSTLGWSFMTASSQQQLRLAYVCIPWCLKVLVALGRNALNVLVCVSLFQKQDGNLFVLDGWCHGPLLCKAKGDPREVLVQHIHQCAKMLARGHPGTCSFKKGPLYPVPFIFNKLVHPFPSWSGSVCCLPSMGLGEGWSSDARG